MAASGDALDCAAPVRSTLFRKENYDKAYTQKNYLIKPAVVMSLVVAFAVFYFVSAEVRIRKNRKKFAAEEAIRRGGKPYCIGAAAPTSPKGERNQKIIRSENL